jgi:hypothetical protein
MRRNYFASQKNKKKKTKAKSQISLCSSNVWGIQFIAEEVSLDK